MDVVVDPLVEEILALVSDAVGGGLGEVAEPVGPAGFEGGADGEGVDELVAFGGVGGGGEGFEIGGVADAAGEVEVDAAEELFVGGEWRMGNIVAAHGAEDVIVDEVAMGDGAGGCGCLAADGGG